MLDMKTLIACLALTTATVILPTALFAADAEQLVDGLNGIFGKQGRDVRASHAKGQCVTGSFTPVADAKALTKSASFEKELPVLARFSMGGGSPKIPDTAKTVVRGLALRIDPNGKAQTEFVMVNAPVHFAKTLDQMLQFFKVRAPGADGKPDAARIKAFSETNPETIRQGAFIAGKPLPASYASINYWAVHAYTVTNAAGANQLVKFKFVPQAGELGLSDDEAKTKPADFLVAELSERLAKAPVRFDMVVIPSRPGDSAADPSQTWTNEDARPVIKLGVLSIAALADNAVCNAGFFDPTNLADGIKGPAEDPFFAIRQPAYAISATRRAN